jgi:hypothetical protein
MNRAMLIQKMYLQAIKLIPERSMNPTSRQSIPIIAKMNVPVFRETNFHIAVNYAV